MSLPKIHVSTIDITIPSTKAKIKFTRFLVRDEKILLLAKESGDQRDILNAIKQVIINTCQDPTVDVNKLSITDLEYIFLKLHAASVSNVAKITVYDPEDEKRYPFDIDLNKVEVDDSKQKDANVKLSETLAVHLNYLPASLYGDKAMTESKDPYSIRWFTAWTRYIKATLFSKPRMKPRKNCLSGFPLLITSHMAR